MDTPNRFADPAARGQARRIVAALDAGAITLEDAWARWRQVDALDELVTWRESHAADDEDDDGGAAVPA